MLIRMEFIMSECLCRWVDKFINKCTDRQTEKWAELNM